MPRLAGWGHPRDRRGRMPVQVLIRQLRFEVTGRRAAGGRERLPRQGTWPADDLVTAISTVAAGEAVVAPASAPAAGQVAEPLPQPVVASHEAHAEDDRPEREVLVHVCGSRGLDQRGDRDGSCR